MLYHLTWQRRTQECVHWHCPDPFDAQSRLKLNLRKHFICCPGLGHETQTMPWLGMGFCKERAWESLSVAWLRADKTERGTGSAPVSSSLGMCLRKRGQFPCLAAPTPSRFFRNCQTTHRTGEWNCLIWAEYVSDSPPASLPSLPSPRFQTWSWPNSFTPECSWTLIYVGHGTKWKKVVV